jgi:type IVB pilus formation R64 PilN family outer membrane protein
MKFSKIFLGLLATTSMAGCTVTNAVDKDVRASSSDVNDLMSQARNRTPADMSPIKVSNSTYVGAKAIRNENGDPLPSKFEGKNGIIFARASTYSMREIASEITKQTKIPVVLAASAEIGKTSTTDKNASANAKGADYANGANTSAATLAPAAGPVPAGFPLNQALAEIQSNTTAVPVSGPITATTTPDTADKMQINYQGSLSGLLDMVSAHFNVAWRYEMGRITIDNTITRSFDVPALATVTGLNFSLGSQSKGSNGGQAKNETKVDFYGELDNGLKALVGQGSYSINKIGGVVTVTGNPATVERVQTYLKDLNERTSQQINLDVKVYAVTLRDSENFSMNLNAALTQATKYGVTLAGSGTAAAATGGGSLSWALLNQSDQFAGTKAVLQALSERGNVSEVTSSVIQTINGQPVPFEIGNEREYIPTITANTSTGGTSNSTSVSNTVAEVNTGFGMQLLPRIERNGDVLLQYGIDISSLNGATNGFDTYKVGDNTVQLKNISRRNFLQQARIPHNTTLVLAGFEQTKSSSSKSGVGSPLFSLLGGGDVSSKQKEALIIVITPTVLAQQ